MSRVVAFPPLRAQACPTLIMVDLQREYVLPPRALALREADLALAHCAQILAFGRKIGLPIAHARMFDNGPYFNRHTSHAGWIEGFEPLPSEMVFERDRPSCYASQHFADVIATSGGRVVIAGFAGEASCLSTAVDAYHRGHEATYLYDASASHEFDDETPESAHRSIVRIIQIYARVSTSDEWVAEMSEQRDRRSRL